MSELLAFTVGAFFGFVAGGAAAYYWYIQRPALRRRASEMSKVHWGLYGMSQVRPEYGASGPWFRVSEASEMNIELEPLKEYVVTLKSPDGREEDREKRGCFPEACTVVHLRMPESQERLDEMLRDGWVIVPTPPVNNAFRGLPYTMT
jgi:hypothetical protein